MLKDRKKQRCLKIHTVDGKGERYRENKPLRGRVKHTLELEMEEVRNREKKHCKVERQNI